MNRGQSLRAGAVGGGPLLGTATPPRAAGSSVLDTEAEQGFTVPEDNGMRGRSPREQTRIGQALRTHEMRMGGSVAHSISWDEPALTTGEPGPRTQFLDELRCHQQITEGNVIPTLDRAWEALADLQVGNTPGRNEPPPGEINVRTVFKPVHEQGYGGIVGMEHGMSGEGTSGEQAVIDAYACVDSFNTPLCP